MKLSNSQTMFIWLLVPIAVLLCPVPQGLTPVAWQLFAMYLWAIAGLILRPLPEPSVLLIVLPVTAIITGKPAFALSGFGSKTAWLVFAAFLVGQCFIDTGLGKRIAYVLIGKMGRTSLGLGYVAAITDMLISPATPSNTARTGGLVFPMFQSLAVTLDSYPGPSARRIGSYLMLLLYQISLTTSGMFITACAIHGLSLTFARSILKVEVTWMQWATGMFPPGLVLLAIVPWLVYKLFPPELKVIDNKTISEKGLAALGAMTRREKTLAVLFVLAILSWATGSITKVDATSVAVAFVGACLFTKVISWEELVNCKGAWGTLIWYGGIISLASALAGNKFFDWLGKLISANIDFTGMGQFTVLMVILFISLVVRYLFASIAAFTSTFIPVLFTIGSVAQVPPVALALLLGASSVLGSLTTHYGNAVAPILFGAGYVDQATWWKIGHIITIVGMIVYIVVGMPLWKVLGFW